jgi:membrane protein implicated in regulation of membrane protease activity
MDFLLMVQPYWLWLGITIVLALIELATAFSLTTIWFAIPAFLLIFISGIVVPVRWQLAIFLFLSLVLLIVIRPYALKKLKTGQVRTNVDSLTGQTALVTKRIAEFEKGEIKLNGQIWSAKPESGGVLEAGVKCTVLRVEGVHAIVCPENEQNPPPQA